MTQGGGWYHGVGGTQNGPITWEELVALTRGGRLRGSDLVWTEGMADWQPAGSIPGLFGPPASPPPAVQAAADPGEDPMMRMLLPVGRSPLAIAAGYLGLFSVLGCFAPFALVVGLLAVQDIRKNPHKHGMGRAVFGIVMGALGTVGLVVMLIAMANS